MTSHSHSDRASRARIEGHATAELQAGRGVRVLNGRLVGPTLADPGMDKVIRAHIKENFPDRESKLRFLQKSGLLTKTGKLTKAYRG